MDRKTVIHISSTMKDRLDLLKLLNHIKRDEMAKMGCLNQYHPFTLKHITYYSNPNNAYHRYTSFKINKKTGGYRQISAPRNRSFMFLLRCLNEFLKAVYTPSQYAMGFVEGRSVVNNARKHIHMNYVLNIDLKDFFPSIEQPRLWKRLQVKPFNFPVEVASVIAGLCCMKTICEDEDEGKKVRYILPQGAPTSPIITNMICDKLDFLLSSVAKRFGVNYSRYADDITFSSMHNVYQKDSDFIKEIGRIITEQGFVINDKKLRLQKVGCRQEVTGITVNDKPNVTRKYVNDIRNMLYIWEKHGYNVAFNCFLSKYVSEKGHVKKSIPDFIRVLNGKLMFLKMVKGQEDGVFVRLNNQYNRLIDKTFNINKTTERGVTYLDTLPIKDFEKRFSTEISIVYRNIQSNPNEGENSVQASTHRYAFFTMGENKIMASINKSLTQEELYQREKLAISSCRDKAGCPFWLIHKIDKKIVSQTSKVDLDVLLKDLEALLQ